MKFRDIQLLTAVHNNEQYRFLMDYWENLRDIFCTLLPANFDFNGISKLNIYLGEFEGEEYKAPLSNGIAEFRIRDFDFLAFKELPDNEKSEKSLCYLEYALEKLCIKFESPIDVSEKFASISEQIRGNGFKLTRLYKKTTKWNKGRSLRAVTTLHNKVGGIDVDFSITNKKGKPIITKKLKSNAYWNSAWFDIFKGYWVDSTFYIENRTGRILYEFTENGEVVT